MSYKVKILDHATPKKELGFAVFNAAPVVGDFIPTEQDGPLFEVMQRELQPSDKQGFGAHIKVWVKPCKGRH